MKMTYGRKFWSCLIGLVLLIYLFTITLLKVPAAITSYVLIVYGAFIITLVFAYVGGNIWKSWIKSKYFVSELNEVGKCDVEKI